VEGRGNIRKRQKIANHGIGRNSTNVWRIGRMFGHGGGLGIFLWEKFVQGRSERGHVKVNVKFQKRQKKTIY